ncbi:MAG: ROK family protein [Cyclobacteriaceae bacterium]
MIYLGVDIGGTNVKAAVVDHNGNLSDKNKKPTQEFVDTGNFTNALADFLADFFERYPEIEKVGIGVPGTLSKDRKSLIEIANIPDINKEPLGQLLADRFKSHKFWFENDANLAALGEYYFGDGKKTKNFIFVTLGTGVGGSAIMDGHLFTGGDGNGMELGHVLVKNGLTLEQNIGKEGIMKRAKVLLKKDSKSALQHLDNYDPKQIAQEGLSGDKLAGKIFKEAGEYLGEALVSAIRLLDIKNIMIGGGLAVGFDLIIDPLTKALNDNLTPYYVKNINVQKAVLGNDAGILGAAALCMENEPGS